MSRIIEVTILEPSAIISQGISAIISNAGFHLKWSAADSLQDFDESRLRNEPDIVFVNPGVIINQLRDFQVMRKNLPDTHWIAIVYTLIDPVILSMFDEIIYINDPPGKIIKSFQRILSPDYQLKPAQENLTERETEVLKLLVAGNANKEIADKLSISTHTVITHRKNISQKTGIKSVSGLTIYAVLKEIISVNDYME